MKKFVLFFIVLISFNSIAQTKYIPTKENLEARKWFEEARFGMFIHWGVYSVLGDGEWVMNNQNISIKEYEKLPSFFNPTEFNAKDWVKIAKDSGMKYITITSRHHDGFSMFNSKATDYTIVKKTPYKKDILKQLADECHKEGIKLFFYYSQLDWYRDDYFPRGRTGTGIKGRGEGEWDDYIDFMKDQLTELLTNYGEIGGIWFDGQWDQHEWDGKRFGKLKADFKLDEVYKLIHKLQPKALIGSNHHLSPNPGEDFQMFEKDLPGKGTKDFATSAEDIGNLPFEVCETINGSWGFNLKDRKHKSKKQLIQYLVKAAGYGSNLLLNVGPMPNGKIQEEHIESLKKIGSWIKQNGQTIYKTKRGPIHPTDEIASTQNGNIIYIHLLDEKKKEYFIEGFNPKIKKISYLKSNKKVSYKKSNSGLTLILEEKEINYIDTIIKLEL
ncbi:MAG: alpha-L-fucosidase [Flavobacteriaceae bacterium]|jgi:alpha-L-fucosidase|nr:alpha-L-fucosidase [Flavobacteriaceae bacterium]MBT3794196.1 alpha-L-fucosidase [Flavobacteriaceae bacterium]MBT5395948.1 alpha-L-fucosidase [Flavobacteriaceae bacterium]MBT5596606.1 alpha-L-fucosidase [Flavobacteriaceae bacterium]MBT5857342.1 alpha-L-fucosidase [Flavobacteriaceae bacterium]|tara:strand:- start:829 stop:2154 length:1326 start_codon:yes stop_codon:yes gene_type:complete